MCSRLIPSLQSPPVLNHTIRICQWAARLPAICSQRRAAGPDGQQRHSPEPPPRPAEIEVTPREKEMLSPLTVVCVSPALSGCIRVGKHVCVHNPVVHFACRVLACAWPTMSVLYQEKGDISCAVFFFFFLKGEKRNNNDLSTRLNAPCS